MAESARNASFQETWEFLFVSRSNFRNREKERDEDYFPLSEQKAVLSESKQTETKQMCLDDCGFRV